MLVLSRSPGEKLVFPTIGVTLEVLRIKGKAARLGINAPADVPILREELADTSAAAAAISQAAVRPNLPHSMRNRLNAASLALHLYQKQLDRGMHEEAEITFAKVIDEFSALEREAAAMAAPAKSATPLTGDKLRRALLVEDDKNECELLAGILRLNGFEVATANDGEAALGYLSSHERPDLMLLDMLMPRCDGPTTLNAIRSDPRLDDMKVIAISGTSPAEFGLKIGPQGIDRWFSKPVHPETLLRELKRELTVGKPVAAKA